MKTKKRYQDLILVALCLGVIAYMAKYKATTPDSTKQFDLKKQSTRQKLIPDKASAKIDKKTAAQPLVEKLGADKTPGNSQAATIISIVDGDTLKIRLNGKEESLRLIGVDTPESRDNEKAERDSSRTGQAMKTILAQGKLATQYLQKILREGDPIKIEFDVQTRDKYQRLLGYVYLKNGRMLNEEIARAGYANIMTVPPNVRYVARLVAAVTDARNNKRGLWAK
jgi:micrococcal nuclease